MNRRAFLRTAGAAAVTGWMGTSLGCGGGRATGAASLPGTLPPLRSIGLQMSTVREPLQRDLRGTLREVARIGYRVVETSADLYEKMSPVELRAALDHAGLRSATGMYQYQAIGDDLDRVIAAARALGQEYICIPSLPQAMRSSRDGYRAAAERFNELGGRIRDAGLTLAYHNHGFEFDTLGGDSPAYDILLDHTDPDRVAFELDLYWIHKGGGDPIEYIDRYPGRFPLYHLKDSTPTPEKDFAPVGEGVIDFREILARANAAGFRYGFVEHDRPEEPMESIRTSYANLADLLPRA
jgi:sugar phosphate isomerase/epimerase